MSNNGQSPLVKRNRYAPQSSDPVNPRDGDFFFSNGTPRAKGPWIYYNSAWQQISTSGALNIVNDLTFDPQSSDPGSPTAGMVFYADGTSRAEGLWIYDGSDWVQLNGVQYQEFYVKDYVEVRVASTANVTLASGVENGDTIDGVVLATGNIVLLKNQTTASENGVYTVNASGAPTRHSSADTFSKLNDYSASVSEGTTNKNKTFFQTAVLTSLSDNQTWATSPASKTFTVPGGKYELLFTGAGAGGAGGCGGGVPFSNTGDGGGGAGGSGGPPITIRQKVTPGETITIQLGTGGLRAAGTTSAGASGGGGSSTTVVCALGTLTFPGGNGGGGGSAGPGHGAGGAADSGINDTVGNMTAISGGNGGQTNTVASANGYKSILALGGTAGTMVTNGVGAGGGGGASIKRGADGADSGVSAGNYNGTDGDNALNSSAAGGGGGSGARRGSSGSNSGGRGGVGSCGYMRISWD